MYRFCLVLFLFFVFWVEPEKMREVIMMIRKNLVDPFFLVETIAMLTCLYCFSKAGFLYKLKL